MSRPPRPRRPCELFCPQCREWKHFSHFRQQQRRSSHGTVTTYRRICKVCEQTNHDRLKNQDRARILIENRCRDWASRLGCSKEFLWSQMNWRSLVPVLRALMTDEGLCQSCGHPFRSERDIQIEHIEPPRHRQDWARHHAANLRLMCGSCNNGKNDQPFATWLDEREANRLSVVALNAASDTTQLSIFDLKPL